MVRCECCGIAPPAAAGPEAAIAAAVDPPITWSREVDRGTVRWMCEACARAHVRAIEGRLDQRWW